VTIRLINGDCLSVLPTLDAGSIDACVTDPPYHLTSITKRFGAANAAPAKFGTDGAFSRAARGFMGQTWDGGDIAFRVETWAEVFRVLKPGAHLAAFGGTRTYHRMACAIEDAGFEIRDTLAWLYGSGFPKSHNAGEGRGTALKPAFEPIILARKPLVGTVAQNVLAHGTGAINVDACRIESADGYAENCVTQGVNTARTSFAPAVVQRTFAPSTLGRWPANVLHDGSDEVEAAFAEFGEHKAGSPISGNEPSVPAKGDVVYGFRDRVASHSHGDTGTASRFFYTAKADAADRAGSKHPTVKPTDLMRYLVRLISPPGGTVLDPFAGTGSTGLAADQLGMNAILIEQSPVYAADAERKIHGDAPLFADVVTA